MTAHDLSDNQILRQVAADMATQVVMSYTCPLAYKHETNEDIKMGDSISDAYLEDRSRHAVELIKMAGVRLAQILELVAESYNSRTIYVHSQGRRVPKTAQDEADEADGWEIAGQRKLKRSPKSFTLLSKSPSSVSGSSGLISPYSGSSSGNASPSSFSSFTVGRAPSAASSLGGSPAAGASLRYGEPVSSNTAKSETSSPADFSTPITRKAGRSSPSGFGSPMSLSSASSSPGGSNTNHFKSAAPSGGVLTLDEKSPLGFRSTAPAFVSSGRPLASSSSAPAALVASKPHVLPISQRLAPASSDIAIINKPVPVKSKGPIKLDRTGR
jgi:hypothetical protein